MRRGCCGRAAAGAGAAGIVTAAAAWAGAADAAAGAAAAGGCCFGCRRAAAATVAWRRGLVRGTWLLRRPGSRGVSAERPWERFPAGAWVAVGCMMVFIGGQKNGRVVGGEACRAGGSEAEQADKRALVGRGACARVVHVCGTGRVASARGGHVHAKGLGSHAWEWKVFELRSCACGVTLG